MHRLFDMSTVLLVPDYKIFLNKYTTSFNVLSQVRDYQYQALLMQEDELNESTNYFY